MMKSEFEKRLGGQVTDEDYSRIETVYMDYPTFQDVAKVAFVDVFKTIGMIGIMDLHPRAQKISELNKEISMLSSRREELRSK